jgi:hypothetical protein
MKLVKANYKDPNSDHNDDEWDDEDWFNEHPIF